MNQRKKNRMGYGKIIFSVGCLALSIIMFGYLFQRVQSADDTGGKDYAAISSSSQHVPEQTAAKDLDSWQLTLVSKQRPMDLGYQPELEEVGNGHQFDKRAAANLKQMIKDAKAAGLSPIICSSFRTIQKQTNLYDAEVQKHKNNGMAAEQASEKAKTVVAYPGTSEHNLGLAADIVALDYQILDDAQMETPEQQWLIKNCAKYGFILRYPVGKSEITGVIFEPWHYRYVGVEAATEIMEQGICLEEYLEQ